MRRAVFLDRDGVINRAIVRDGKPQSPASVAELEILPGVADAMEQLHRAGFLLIVVTNQPEVARGRLSRRDIEEMHSRLRTVLPIDEIRVCVHDDGDGCACRKPLPGLLYAAAVERDIRLADSFMVGDRWRDVAAGQRAGCTTVFVDRGYDEPLTVEPQARTGDLRQAAAWILSHGNV